MVKLLIKNKIKQLLSEKKVKKSRLALDLGFNKSFFSNIFASEKKFFNLEQIEKICKALDYPVWKLFKEEEEELPADVLTLAEPETENVYRADDSELDRAIKKLNRLPKEKREHAIKLIKNMVDMVDAYE